MWVLRWEAFCNDFFFWRTGIFIGSRHNRLAFARLGKLHAFSCKKILSRTKSSEKLWGQVSVFCRNPGKRHRPSSAGSIQKWVPRFLCARAAFICCWQCSIEGALPGPMDHLHISHSLLCTRPQDICTSIWENVPMDKTCCTITWFVVEIWWFFFLFFV